MQEYPIYDGENIVGSAQVVQEGMTLCIRCVCRQDNKMGKISIQWGGGSLLLGKCFPEKEIMTLFRRISKRELPRENFSFAVWREDRERLDASVPIQDLSRLRSAKLVVENGDYYLDYSNSKPTGQ